MIAVDDESFMVLGIDRWDVAPADLIPERRLELQLHVARLYRPPAEAAERSPKRFVPVIRFPLMQSCSGCNRLDYHWLLSADDNNACGHCDRALVPSRFVVACEKGHIEDFPYSRWAHRGREPEGEHILSLSTSGSSASLRDLMVTCSCKAERSLEGAFSRHELGEIARCQGKRPWLGDREECGGSLRTVQRGASNVWFSSVRSALSIPPWSDGVFQLIERFWLFLRSAKDPAMLENFLIGMGPALTAHGYDIQELVRAILARQAEEAGDARTADQLRRQEYEALLAGREERGSNDQFVATASAAPKELEAYFDRVASVPRLREVRVLEGFSRLHPIASAEGVSTDLSPLAKGHPGWLPAIEVRGEGVFLRFNRHRLDEWESHPEIARRAASVTQRLQWLEEKSGREPNRVVAPRLLLIHSFAHALIEELSLDAGYPAASLRERLFVSDEMCGALVYTATSDAAGSLGGLTAQAAPHRLVGLIRQAIQRAAWCSADPVCIESMATGTNGLNNAACHACSLLPETSCEERNEFLDRATLVGTEEHPDIGYFSLLLRGGP